MIAVALPLIDYILKTQNLKGASQKNVWVFENMNPHQQYTTYRQNRSWFAY